MVGVVTVVAAPLEGMPAVVPSGPMSPDLLLSRRDLAFLLHDWLDVAPRS